MTKEEAIRYKEIITEEVKGVKGTSCTDITKALLDGIAEIQKIENTPEYFETDCEVARCNTG